MYVQCLAPWVYRHYHNINNKTRQLEIKLADFPVRMQRTTLPTGCAMIGLIEFFLFNISVYMMICQTFIKHFLNTL